MLCLSVMKLTRLMLMFLVWPFEMSNTTDCGFAGKWSPRIIGGTDVRHRGYSWFVGLVEAPVRKFSKLLVFCGGTLITDRDVLTAAHCIEPFIYPTYSIAVFVGINNVCRPAESLQYLHIIKKAEIHPYYHSRSTWYDIGILSLEKPSTFPTARLPSIKESLPTNLRVIGFGILDNMHRRPCQLHFVDICLYNKTTCRQILTEKKSSATMIRAFCAGFHIGGKDSCLGDSGGPAFAPALKMDYPTVYGIVSFGFNCGMPGELGFYTDVRNFLIWIQENLTGTINKNFQTNKQNSKL